MKIQRMQGATVLLIENSAVVDPIRVSLTKGGTGTNGDCGSITISCYGNAWTAYFGSIAKPIDEFVADVVTDDYLVSKLMRNRETKLNKNLLTAIVREVKAAIKIHRSQTVGRDNFQP